MIEMTRFEDFPVSIRGDFYELLALFAEQNAAASVGFVPAPDFMSVEERGGKTLLSAKFHEKPDEAAIRAALERAGASDRASDAFARKRRRALFFGGGDARVERG